MERQKRIQTAAQKITNFLGSNHVNQYIISGYAVTTLHALGKYFYYSDKCWPSIDGLVKYTHFSDKQVRRSLFELERLELIKIIRKNGAKNVYVLNIPIIEDCEIYGKKGDNFCG